jgi:hypothetical protein
MARRTTLNDADTRLLWKLRRGRFTAAELHWLLDHLGDDVPTSVLQDIHRILADLRTMDGTKEPKGHLP